MTLLDKYQAIKDKMRNRSELENKIASTDYKIIKSYEYQMAGLELPYDIEELHLERESLREEIRALRDN